jgi:hypothetical protein
VQSQNGINWTVASQLNADDFYGIYLTTVTPSQDGSKLMAWYSGGAYAAIASVNSSGIGQFSSVGLPLGSVDTIVVASIIHNGTSFVAVGANGGFQYSNVSGYSGIYSGSGTSWTNGSFQKSLLSVAYRGSRYVATSYAGIVSSNDGLNWVLRQSGTGSQTDYALSMPGGYVASLAGNIFTSTDGLSWTSRTDSGVLPFVAGEKVYVSPIGSTSRGSGTLVAPGGVTSATFSSSATTSFGSPAIQWQKSTNGGSTWTNVSGAVSGQYQFTPVSGDNGAKYRAVFTKDSYTTVNSNSATLTVP